MMVKLIKTLIVKGICDTMAVRIPITDNRAPVKDHKHAFGFQPASLRKQKEMKQTMLITMILSIFIANAHTAMSQANNIPQQDSAFLGTHWTLVSIGGKAIPRVSREAFIVFDGEKQSAYCSSGCNRMTGKFTVEEGKLRIGPMAGTRMACDPESMQLETAFYKALSEADGYMIQGNQLFLKNGAAVVAELQATGK
jgi:heat shock protein HslJ